MTTATPPRRPTDRYRSAAARGVSLLLLGVTLSAGAAGQRDDIERIGRAEFIGHCASCHGPEGRGDGPVAGLLRAPPPDLSTLERRHDGRFPFLAIAKTIDGRALPAAHGEREMPVWGRRYRAEQDLREGPFAAELIARGRILSLVYYIETLQRD